MSFDFHEANPTTAPLDVLDALDALDAPRAAEGYASSTCAGSTRACFEATRIPASTGLLVAGVIGAKRYRYDLLRDTVNGASSKQSEGNAAV